MSETLGREPVLTRHLPAARERINRTARVGRHTLKHGAAGDAITSKAYRPPIKATLARSSKLAGVQDGLRRNTRAC